MNIAFFVPYVPSRIRTRSFHLLKTLTHDGHRVTLFTLWSDSVERQALAQIQSFGIHIIAAQLTRRHTVWNSLRGLLTANPLQAVYAWEPQLAQRWLEALGRAEFDIAHVEHLRGAPYACAARDRFKNLPLVWDSVDCISALFAQTRAKSAHMKNRVISSVEYPRTRVYEAALIRAFPQTTVVAESERRALLALPSPSQPPPETRIHVVPMGIDTEYFARRSEEREPATLVFSGKMSYHANLTAARFLLDNIMPLVWAQLPAARVMIVGANPPASLHAAAAASGGRILVTDTVPDIRPYLERATVAVAPMVYAVGMQSKLLEAMAMQTPVIATQGAVAPLNAQAERDLCIAESAEEFSRKILNVIENPALQKKLAVNGRAFVRAHFSWRASTDKLLDVYERARRDAAQAAQDA